MGLFGFCSTRKSLCKLGLYIPQRSRQRSLLFLMVLLEALNFSIMGLSLLAECLKPLLENLTALHAALERIFSPLFRLGKGLFEASNPLCMRLLLLLDLLPEPFTGSLERSPLKRGIAL